MFQIHSLSKLMQIYAITLTLPCAIVNHVKQHDTTHFNMYECQEGK